MQDVCNLFSSYANTIQKFRLCALGRRLPMNKQVCFVQNISHTIIYWLVITRTIRGKGETWEKAGNQNLSEKFGKSHESLNEVGLLCSVYFRLYLFRSKLSHKR